MQVAEVKCPSCGSPVRGLRGNVARCPFCGSAVYIPPPVEGLRLDGCVAKTPEAAKLLEKAKAGTLRPEERAQLKFFIRSGVIVCT
ncbi:MAG: hypothetical protein QXI84_09285 [Thermofilaceae archaeon]